MNHADKIGDELRRIAEEARASFGARGVALRERAAQLLADRAMLEIERAGGIDVTTREIAWNASAANAAREEIAFAVSQARETALRAVVTVLTGLAAA